MSTVKLPGIGPVDKKWVIAGVAGTGGILVYAYWKASRAGSDATVVDGEPDSGEISTDEGVGNTAGSTGDSSGNFSNIDPAIIDTIQEWTADVVETMSAAGWDAMLVTQTIGKWVNGQGLTIDEKLLIYAAIAAGGQPPGGPYPILTALPNPSPSPTPTPSPAAVPGVPGHFHITSRGPGSLAFAWNSSKPAAAYYQLDSPETDVYRVQETAINITGLKPKTTYHFRVRGLSSDGKAGPWSGTANVTTT